MISGIPEGYALDRIGYPMPGEKFIGHTGVVYDYPDCDVEIQHPVAIVSPKEGWKILRAIAWDGQPTRARFRTRKNDPWHFGYLVSYRPGVCKWQADDGRWFRVCETWRV
jgi:hypothetical protein